jgi:hypothetical protein
MLTRGIPLRVLVGSMAAAALLAVGSGAAAATPGPCELYAPSTAAIERTLGAGGQEPIDSGTFCYIEGKGVLTRIYPYPASKARARKALDLTVYEGRPTITTHPTHLGKGATMVRPRRGGQIDVFFTRGRHSFTITGDSATPAQMVAFARAVYNKH